MQFKKKLNSILCQATIIVQNVGRFRRYITLKTVITLSCARMFFGVVWSAACWLTVDLQYLKSVIKTGSRRITFLIHREDIFELIRSYIPSLIESFISDGNVIENF